MNKINNTKALVQTILETVPETRSSDMRLYYEVCRLKSPQALNLSFAAVIMNLNYMNLPPFESVRRSRQKVQAECPHLAAAPEIQTFRAENEEKYREFARG